MQAKPGPNLPARATASDTLPQVAAQQQLLCQQTVALEPADQQCLRLSVASGDLLVADQGIPILRNLSESAFVSRHGRQGMVLGFAAEGGPTSMHDQIIGLVRALQVHI